MIKKHGGVFGRNPTFNDVTVEGDLNISGALTIDGETITALDYQGTWDASTNTPTLTSSTGNTGEVYIVSTTGTTTLDGISNWGAGDMLVFSGTQWERIEGSPDGNFVNVSSSGTASFTGAITVTGTANFNGTNNVNADMDFADGVKANFGAGSDLQIYHDGTNSYINDVGTGKLRLGGDTNVAITNAANTTTRIYADDTTVALKSSNANVLVATSTGIDVTGTVTADGLTVDVNNSTGSIVTDYAMQITNADTTAGSVTGMRLTQAGSYGWGDAYIYSETPFNHASALYFATEANSADLVRDRLKIDWNGDISFYEDTGTTPKFFWDASAERLAIGASSPTAKLSIADNYPFVHFNSASNVTQAFAGFHYDFNAMLVGTSTAIPLRLHTNSTERMRITGSGNVGIGTDTPTDKLHIDNLSGDTYLRISNNTAGRMFVGMEGSEGVLYSQTSAGAAQPMAFHVGSSEAMRIDSSGNVGIGTSNPNAQLDISDATEAYMRLTHTGSNYWQISNDSNLKFNRGGTERMRIDSSGNLLVGKTSSANAQTTVGHLFVPDGRHYATASGGVSGIFSRTTSDGDIVSFYKDGSQVGSISTKSGYVVIGTGDTGMLFNDDIDAIFPYNTNGTGVDGLKDLGTYANRFKDLYLSGGVYLGGTGSANYLDDYEEGTFTPTLFGATTSGSNTYTYQTGNYTKVGRQVTVDIYLGVSYATGTGAIKIGGLPFARASQTAGSGSVMVDQYNWSSGTYLTAFIQPDQSNIEIYSNADDATWNRLSVTNEVQRFLITYTYFTS